jgi:DnaJ-class molecular chaperone
MGFVFGQDVPCRGCHGAGQRVEAMTPEAKREHERQKRRDKRSGIETPRAPLLKTCSECQGRGYVSPAVADRRRYASP